SHRTRMELPRNGAFMGKGSGLPGAEGVVDDGRAALSCTGCLDEPPGLRIDVVVLEEDVPECRDDVRVLLRGRRLEVFQLERNIDVRSPGYGLERPADDVVVVEVLAHAARIVVGGVVD